MNRPVIIQGGMGVGVSYWRLANAVSKRGHLGVVSGTAINTLFVRRLQDGDLGGHVRRALAAFPDQTLVQDVLQAYFLPEGLPVGGAYKLSPMPALQPSMRFHHLCVLGAFVEVWLAKEGHSNPVGINLLEKLQTSNLSPLYGAMLAGVDYVLMGAGIPREIPGVLDLFAQNKKASIHVNVGGAPTEEQSCTSFDPNEAFPNLQLSPLKRPDFLAIISSATLASHLAKKATGRVDGFIVEGPLAGGHNAPPRGPMKLNESGQPIYGVKDVPDLVAIKDIGLPFWLAGSYASSEKLGEAIALGAVGIQVGTAFAFCEESGISDGLKQDAIQKWSLAISESTERVFTDPRASPTDFPFKVAPLGGTLSDATVYAARPRKCDLGYLRSQSVGPSGNIVYRCPSEPVDQFVKKGGAIEDTVGRKCLCNALLANIGHAQKQSNGYEELALLTAGDDVVTLYRFVPSGKNSYTAADVIERLEEGLRPAQSRLENELSGECSRELHSSPSVC